jgi:hypothetical protein
VHGLQLCKNWSASGFTSKHDQQLLSSNESKSEEDDIDEEDGFMEEFFAVDSRYLA